MLSRRDLPVFAALTITAACRPQAVALSSADQQAVRATMDSVAQRFRRGDYRSTAALFATNAHVMPPNQPIVVGRENFLRWMSALPPISSFELTVEELDGQGDVAYVRARYTLTSTPPGAKAAVSETGKELDVLRRQPDGSWPIVAGIWNSDKPETH